MTEIEKGLLSRLEQAAGKGTKDDHEKIMIDLVEPEFIEGVAKILTYGAKKYEAYNWRNDLDIRRIYAGVQRHLILGYAKGEMDDDSSGLLHLDHAACGIMFLRWYLANKGRNMQTKVKPDNAFCVCKDCQEIDKSLGIIYASADTMPPHAHTVTYFTDEAAEVINT